MKKNMFLSTVVSAMVMSTSALVAIDFNEDVNVAEGSVNVTPPGQPIGPTRTMYPSMSMGAEGDASVAWLLGVGTDTTEPGQNAVGFVNPISGSGPLFIVNDAVSDLLILSQDSVAVNSVDLDDTLFGTANLIVAGDMLATWSGSNAERDGTKYLVTLSADNSEAGKTSDAGFALENVKEGFKWEFRTYEAAEGFTATKALTGGGEFIIENTTTDYHNAKMIVGGVTIFENGQLQTPSSRALKTDIKPLDTKAALDAFHKLQPVSYAYKAHKDEPVVGFIAEDIPDLVATKTRTGIDSTEIVAVLTKVLQEQDKSLAETRAELKKAQEKIAKLEKMQKRLAKVESLLTNLALDTSNSKKEKVSLNK